MASKYKKLKLKDGSTIDEHRYIMQEHLGRKLTFNEVVHHKDDDKSNNDLSNLEVLTRSEHSRIHMKGKPFIGRVSQELINNNAKKRAKLTNEQVIEIRRLFETSIHKRDLAAMFNISVPIIYAIIKGKAYKWV